MSLQRPGVVSPKVHPTRVDLEVPRTVLPELSPSLAFPSLTVGVEDVIMHQCDDEVSRVVSPAIPTAAAISSGDDGPVPPLPSSQSQMAQTPRNSLSPPSHDKSAAPKPKPSKPIRCLVDSEFDLTQLDPRLHRALEACRFVGFIHSCATSPTGN